MSMVTPGANDLDPQPIEIDLVQKVALIVNILIKEVNLELKVFNLSLTKPLKSLFHTSVVILLTKLYYDEQQIHFQKLLTTVNDQENSLRDYFIRMVVQDASYDENFAENFVKQTLKISIEILLKKAEKLIDEAVEANKHFSRKAVQELCDNALLTKDTQWLLNYVQNPTHLIEERFTELWEDVERAIDQQLDGLKADHCVTLDELFSNLQYIHDLVITKGSPTQFIDDIFQSSQGSANENLTNKGRCMSVVLYNYLAGEPLSETFTFNEKAYHLKKNGIQIFEQLRKLSPKVSELTVQMKSTYDLCSITNLSTFLTAVITKKDDTCEELLKWDSTFVNCDKKGTYKRLLIKARGCSEHCPCCNRPCDADHTATIANVGCEDNKHRCQMGHQFRGMAGYKFEVSNEASLFMCEDLKDKQQLIVNETRKTWAEFKHEHADWDFDTTSLSENELNRLRGKYATIWQKIGKELCQHFGMEYVMHNSNLAGTVPCHYILLLDGSGSMQGRPWSALIEAVTVFIGLRIEADTDDRITVLVFTDSVSPIFINEELKYVDTAKIRYTGGGTDFAAVFTYVPRVIELLRQDRNFCKFQNIVIFMSDGAGHYPTTELNYLRNNYQSVICKFWTVALGTHDTNVLAAINATMNGEYKNIKESCELAQAYAEIARN
ncbi:unnamed protein product [Didymodactylos carnosus]|uniref:VWFA domain-containing protein n=1 Tax=Didymodactylos carnosus TaxID=1234261 RepID=A0A8S2D7M0_9BILA|nr:unnamed protein product [Didymodactylos carnosus]CAF3608212.1 unnamed protein product [Didymodactylos carnosus]